LPGGVGLRPGLRRHRQRLFSYLLRLTRNRELAEDLMQETWLRLATHADRLRPGTCFAAWLFTVARNLFLSHQRSRGRDAGRTGELGCVTLTEDEGA
jgi:RNA polymerase sigma-70 factor (ECF subfamily)